MRTSKNNITGNISKLEEISKHKINCLHTKAQNQKGHLNNVLNILEVTKINVTHQGRRQGSHYFGEVRRQHQQLALGSWKQELDG